MHAHTPMQPCDPSQTHLLPYDHASRLPYDHASLHRMIIHHWLVARRVCRDNRRSSRPRTGCSDSGSGTNCTASSAPQSPTPRNQTPLVQYNLYQENGSCIRFWGVPAGHHSHMIICAVVVSDPVVHAHTVVMTKDLTHDDPVAVL